MSEHERAPLPWAVRIEDGRVEGIYGQPSEFFDGRVIETDSGYYPPGIEDANLIVEAVNEHALLRRVAEAAESAVGEHASIAAGDSDKIILLSAALVAWKKASRPERADMRP
jgi:hypothetical protein